MVKKSRHLHPYILAFVVVLILVLAALYATHIINPFHRSPVVSTPTAPLTQLPTKSTKTNSNQPPISAGQIDQQGDVDKNGQAPSSVSSDQSKWTVSQSGLITVKTPSIGSTLKPGDEVYGSAQVGQVQYRLIDNQVGVISQGFIKVVNGNFGAAINFKPYSSSGRLDVFSTDQTGKELNEVQITVNF